MLNKFKLLHFELQRSHTALASVNLQVNPHHNITNVHRHLSTTKRLCRDGNVGDTRLTFREKKEKAQHVAPESG